MSDTAPPADGNGAKPTRAGPRLRHFTDLLDIIVKLGLVVGGVIAIIQYFDAKADKRVERTLAYATRFQEEPVLSAQQRLVAVFREQADLAVKLNAAPLSKADRSDQEAEFVQYLRSEAYGTGVEAEIDLVVGFMDDVANCVKAEICDRPTASRYFGPFAAQVADNLTYYIDEVRARRTPAYAGGLREVAALAKAPGQ